MVIYDYPQVFISQVWSDLVKYRLMYMGCSYIQNLNVWNGGHGKVEMFDLNFLFNRYIMTLKL